MESGISKDITDQGDKLSQTYHIYNPQSPQSTDNAVIVDSALTQHQGK